MKKKTNSCVLHLAENREIRTHNADLLILTFIKAGTPGRTEALQVAKTFFSMPIAHVSRKPHTNFASWMHLGKLSTRRESFCRAALRMDLLSILKGDFVH